MDLVVEEISSMIPRGYEGDLRFSRQNVIIRHKEERKCEAQKSKLAIGFGSVTTVRTPNAIGFMAYTFARMQIVVT
jgi:hypothetical protein